MLPTASGWSSTIAFFSQVLVTAAPSSSARARTRPAAPALVTPPPAMITGRSAAARSWTARSSATGFGASRPSTVALGGARAAATSVLGKSRGMETCTGPGRPEVATRKASCSTSGTRVGARTSTDIFVMGRKTDSRSISWKAPSPRAVDMTWELRRTIGEPSTAAAWTPMTVLEAPGERETSATAGRPVSSAYPSAMWAATCSWRTRMKRGAPVRYRTSR